MTGEIDDLIPQPRTVTIAGRVLTLHHLTMRDYPAFMQAVAPALPALFAGELMTMVTAHTDRVKAAVCIGSDADPEWLDSLAPETFVEVVEAAFDFHADFFLRRVQPAVVGAAKRLLARLNAARAGATSSPSSDG